MQWETNKFCTGKICLQNIWFKTRKFFYCQKKKITEKNEIDKEPTRDSKYIWMLMLAYAMVHTTYAESYEAVFNLSALS